MKPVIFISHSSKDNARATALRQALAATGTLDTAFDRENLVQGETYRPQLFRWMARCHGAVLLLTEAVMDEPYWVLQEATLLAARAQLEGPAFRFYLLIDAKVYDHDTWKKVFAPLKLTDMQRTKLLQPGDSTDDFVKAVAQGMDGVVSFGADHQSRLAELIFDALAPFLAATAAARALAEWAQLGDAAWQGIVPAENTLRALYARRFAVEDLMRQGGLNALFDRLQDKANPEQRRQLLKVLQSHWVPLVNASRLADSGAALQPPQAGAAPANLIVLQTEFTAAEKVAQLHWERRFMPYSRLGRWLSVPWGDEGTATFDVRLRVELQRRFFTEEPDIAEADIIDQLADDLAQEQYTFVHVAGVQTAAHLLPTARRYWPCLFVLTAKAQTAGALAQELALQPVGPPHAEEVARMRDLGKARGLVAQQA